MLTLTDNATAIVRELAAQPGLPPGASLRITVDPSPLDGEQAGFEVSAAPREDGDQVVEHAGATLFLDQVAADVLDDKVLDAAVDETGHVEFALDYQD